MSDLPSTYNRLIPAAGSTDSPFICEKTALDITYK